MTSSASAKRIDSRLLICIIPAVIVGVLYEVFLGHRHDYTGHYAAGYGGTLGAAMVWLRLLSPERFQRYSTISIGPVCVACVLLGVCTEATAFRIAKFDEIDFFNQSLGAVLAAIVTLAHTGMLKPPDIVFDRGLITGVAFLLIGSCFAVA